MSRSHPPVSGPDLDPVRIRAALACLPSIVPADLARLWPLFLLDMLTFYLPPFKASCPTGLLTRCVAALRLYVEELAHFPDEALGAGWRAVRRTHKGLHWPDAAFIASACRTAEKKAGLPPPGVHARLPYWKRDLLRMIEPCSFNKWISPLELVAVDDGLAVLSAPTRAHADQVMRGYRDLILRHLGREYPDIDGIEMTVMAPAAPPVFSSASRVFA